MPRLTRTDRTAIWQQRLARYLQSNQSVADFCKAEDISAPSFYQWKRRLTAQHDADNSTSEVSSNGAQFRLRKSSSTPFTELVVTGQPDTAQAQLPNGVSNSCGRDAAIVPTIVGPLIAFQSADATKSPSASRRPC